LQEVLHAGNLDADKKYLDMRISVQIASELPLASLPD
jgi:hypothetical protein